MASLMFPSSAWMPQGRTCSGSSASTPACEIEIHFDNGTTGVAFGFPGRPERGAGAGAAVGLRRECRAADNLRFKLSSGRIHQDWVRETAGETARSGRGTAEGTAVRPPCRRYADVGNDRQNG